jgi:hypothetical protein
MSTEPDHLIRTKPRPHETISIGGRVKWRLDALCLAGRRSRTATIDVLIDFYAKHNPSVRDFISERENDPKPIQLKRARVASDTKTETD